MSTKADLMNALRSAVAAALPARVVTRDFVDFSQRKQSDLQAGVITVIGHGTAGYGEVMGRFGTPGQMGLILVGQVQVAANAAASAVEDAEFALLEEVEAFCSAPPAPLGGLLIKSSRQSGQVDHPYGWVACELELLL